MKKSDAERDPDKLLQTARYVRREAEKRRKSAGDDEEAAWLEDIIWLTREWENTALEDRE